MVPQEFVCEVLDVFDLFCSQLEVNVSDLKANFDQS